MLKEKIVTSTVKQTLITLTNLLKLPQITDKENLKIILVVSLI